MENFLKTGSVKIVKASEDYLCEIANIEARSFSTPWNENDFHILMTRDYAAVIAAVNDSGNVVGYGCVTTVSGESEILNIAVDKRFRSLGIGGLLLDRMMEISFSKGGSKIFLDVRESNVSARRLYSSRGFFENGIRKNYYKKPVENAVLMLYERHEI